MILLLGFLYFFTIWRDHQGFFSCNSRYLEDEEDHIQEVEEDEDYLQEEVEEDKDYLQQVEDEDYLQQSLPIEEEDETPPNDEVPSLLRCFLGMSLLFVVKTFYSLKSPAN